MYLYVTSWLYTWYGDWDWYGGMTLSASNRDLIHLFFWWKTIPELDLRPHMAIIYHHLPSFTSDLGVHQSKVLAARNAAPNIAFLFAPSRIAKKEAGNEATSSTQHFLHVL